MYLDKLTHVVIFFPSFLSFRKTRAKNGENAFLLRSASGGQAQVRPINKLDEACTNADDRMMRVEHRSGDRVMS